MIKNLELYNFASADLQSVLTTKLKNPSPQLGFLHYQFNIISQNKKYFIYYSPILKINFIFD